jgi:hypothetical protein
MLLRDVRVNIPPNLVESSEILMDFVSSVDDNCINSDFALPIPEECLNAWVAFYCTETKLLRCSEIRDMVNCLLVCFAARSQLQFC